MATSSSSRNSGRSNPQRPSTPEQSRPTITRTGSFSVAPKSEYLRNALQARRAQNTPTPLPLEVRPPPPSASKLPEIKTPRTSPDMFAEFALTEEHTAPVSPIRRRRPSDVGPPRSKTNRELTNEVEKLKDNLMTSNMRVELLKKNNSELQHTLTQLKEQVEELEALEEENNDLRDENNCLKLKMQEMEEEIARLKDGNNGLRKSNEDLLAINIECASHWEDQESAVQEAADTIISLEAEKAALAAEVHKLKKRMTALEDSSTASTLVDGSTRYPSRVYSIDESHPSTSHFDSDYFSQPNSPQVRTSRESIISIMPSERSKKFLDLSEVRRRSARDLVKRMSAASLNALSVRSPSLAPEVPQIPAVFQQQIPQITEQAASDKRVAKTPKRCRERRLPQQPLLDALQISPTRSELVAPRSLTPQPDGLRGLYRPERTTVSRTSNDSCLSSSHVTSPTVAAKPSRRHPSGTEVSPRVPSRDSSKHAHTSSSNEHMSQGNLRRPQQRRQSESDMGTVDTLPIATEEWASMPHPPIAARSSLVAENDLTSEVDPQENKDRWWRSVDRLNQPHQTRPQAQQPHFVQAQIQGTHATVTLSHPQPQQQPPVLLRSQSRTQTQANTSDPTTRPSATGITRPSKTRREDELKRIRTQPSTPAATTPYVEKDFFFNGAEDEEAFMRKAKARIGGRR